MSTSTRPAFGLIIAALSGVFNLFAVFAFFSPAQPPGAAVVLEAAIGLLTLVGVVLAWRGVGIGLRVALLGCGSSILFVLVAVALDSNARGTALAVVLAVVRIALDAVAAWRLIPAQRALARSA